MALLLSAVKIVRKLPTGYGTKVGSNTFSSTWKSQSLSFSTDRGGKKVDPEGASSRLDVQYIPFYCSRICYPNEVQRSRMLCFTRLYPGVG